MNSQMHNTRLQDTSVLSQANQPQQKQAILSVLAAVILWSASYVITKIGVGSIPPLTFGAIRFLFAAAVVGLIALFFKRIEHVPIRDILRLGIGGLLGITAYFSLQNMGVQRTSASDATLLVASFPAITMFLEAIFLKARLSFIRLAGVGIAFLGIYLIIYQGTVSTETNRLEGDFILLATGIAWALYNFSTQKIVQKYATFTVIFWQTLIGAAAFLPLALIEIRAWQPLSLEGVFSAFFLGVFCSVAAFMLYGYGLKSLSAGSAVSLMNLVPVFGLMLAVIGLKEHISLLQMIGGIIVIGGVALSIRKES